MPEISTFYGIRVTMYYSDHNPPHFHVEYGSSKALINIKTSSVLVGSLPMKQLKMVLAWCEIHQAELLENWDLAAQNQPLKRIPPLI